MTRERELLLNLYLRYRWARRNYNQAIEYNRPEDVVTLYHGVMIEAHNSLMAAKHIWNEYEH